MNANEIGVICREDLGLRIGPAMAEYVADCIEADPSRQTIAVIGGDARTGLPMHKEISISDFRNESRS
jgi:ribosomal protein S6E (S10)